MGERNFKTLGDLLREAINEAPKEKSKVHWIDKVEKFINSWEGLVSWALLFVASILAIWWVCKHYL